MGYNTKYSLKTQGEMSKIIDALYEMSDEALYALSPSGKSAEWCKWYEHQEDMVKVSRLFPEEVITLSGWGEEVGDSWTKEFKDGKMTIIN